MEKKVMMNSIFDVNIFFFVIILIFHEYWFITIFRTTPGAHIFISNISQINPFSRAFSLFFHFSIQKSEIYLHNQLITETNFVSFEYFNEEKVKMEYWGIFPEIEMALKNTLAQGIIESQLLLNFLGYLPCASKH